MIETIEITVDEYKRLVDDSKFLRALMNAGVDNWSGYDYAVDIYNGEDD